MQIRPPNLTRHSRWLLLSTIWQTQPFKRIPPFRTWLPPTQHSPKPLLKYNSPSHKCALPASQPLLHQLLLPLCRKPVSAPHTEVISNLLGTRLGTARCMVISSRSATTAPHARHARPAISLVQTRKTSWVATLTTLDTLPPQHPPPDEAHQQTFNPSPLLG